MFTKFFKKQKITTEDLIKFGTISGLLEIVYIVLVAGFFILSESIFNIESKSAILGIIAVLMLLVFSATISAVLIFGILFYLLIIKKY